MRKIPCILVIITALISSSCSENNILTAESDFMAMSVDSYGNISKLTDRLSGRNYLHTGTPAPLLSLKTGESILLPRSAFLVEEGSITLIYNDTLSASLQYMTTPTHIRIELVSLSGSVDAVIWGPYPTTISKIIGETIGVVRGETYAIGLQSLNPKTLGGYPWNENDCMPQIDIFDQDDPTDLSEEGKRYVLYRVEAAMPTTYGSSLQAYCRDRSSERVIENWGQTSYVAPPFDDNGVRGSAIALFGCPVDSALSTIGKIEIAENLPHPLIDGEWGKTARSASAAYLILDFSEKDIARALELTRQAGLRYLYHSNPFETWGHFRLNPDYFPGGEESLKKCVAIADKEGIMLGLHTLSNFITPNDAYVSPVPDPRLAMVGSSRLSAGIGRDDTEIPVDDPTFFRQFENNNMRTVKIGDELIRYGSVSDNEPWKLTDCLRGSFGTKAASHDDGAVIGKLADHAYKVFLTNPELTIEMAENIAGLYNETGVRQISFDGLEGNRSTGMGNYGEILFTTTWYNSLSDNIRSHFIADASRTSHYFWHIYSRMNWGEPWYAGFRESQTEYRLKNQEYFSRNLMPGMLGWFRMYDTTTPEDAEWMLARSAAFNAGYAFVVDYESMEKNGYTDTILKLISTWEKARMADAFTPEQRERMKDINNEFSLTRIDSITYQLNQVYSFKFSHKNIERQPGEPEHSTFVVSNPADEQPASFIITAEGGTLSDIRIVIDNHRELAINISLRDGESLNFTGENSVTRYSKTWQETGSIPADAAAMKMPGGEHTIDFYCIIDGDNDSRARVEFRMSGKDELISL